MDINIKIPNIIITFLKLMRKTRKFLKTKGEKVNEKSNKNRI